MIANDPPTGLPAQPFFSTPQQRLALARQRYFEEGVRPSGLVGEGVIQSWARCLQAKRHPREAIAFNPVTPSRVHSALARSRVLLEAAAGELTQLESTLAGTTCTAILTDPHGVVVHATRTAPTDEHVLMPLASRVGVCLDEDHIGTNAPGVTARTGQASVVLGGEHFFGCVQVMHCAAAPIRDARGQLAGVLDVSSESRPFGFDAAAVVALCATAIENRLLRAQSQEHIVLHFQTTPGLLGTPMEGLAGITSDGRLAWVNNAGARLLGQPQLTAAVRADDVLGIELHRLAARTRHADAWSHRLPSGLCVWMLAHMQSPDGAARTHGWQGTVGKPPAGAAESVRHTVVREPCATPASAAAGVAADASSDVGNGGRHGNGGGFVGSGSGGGGGGSADGNTAGTDIDLRTAGRHLIERTLAECGGNVSQAARKLGVSRGLIYRHARKSGGPN